MRKVMLLAAMLAMVLAAAAPAFAQDAIANDDSVATGGDVQYVDCTQIAAAVQAQYGDATAVDDSVAAVASEQGVTQNQVQACLGDVNNVIQAGEDVEVDVGSASSSSDDGGSSDDGSASASASSSSSSSASSSASSSSSASAAASGELPETGGASLLALGAGALLVAGGLLARRIVR